MRIFALLLILCACGNPEKPAPAAPSKPKAETGAPAPSAPTADEARAFVKKVDAELKTLWVIQAEAEWTKATDITDANEKRAAEAATASMNYLTQAIKASRRFDSISKDLDADTARKLLLLKLAGTTAPADPARASELADVGAHMESIYGKGKVCAKPDQCKDLGALEDILAHSRKPDELLATWEGWHREVGRAIAPIYPRFVELANEGAREVGFADLGERWRAGYDMSAEQFEAEVERLWKEVKPLYDPLHCYVRRQLGKKYGKKLVPDNGPIPAHLLGNMWAQDWSNVYPLVEPYAGQTNPDVTATMVKQGYTPEKMVKTAEGFFMSLGMDALPDTFWQRSMLVKPAGKEAVCHASAWDVSFNDDVRIKMCIKINQDDLITIHHELGHDYYFHYYHTLPVLYQSGAHDGFHEAIGDTIALSVTPEYLQRIGLLANYKPNPKALINSQMFRALDKIAFLPWGLLVDKWRWDVFSGQVKPADYNKHWWELREKYQGVKAPMARDAKDFDPGAKYHVASNTPYVRYFLSFVIQFQFHRALCQAAGHKGPLYTCSIYGSKAAGERLMKMLSMGASKEWKDEFEVLTGSREMSGDALVEYFQPLIEWLEQQNKGKKCGW